MKEKDIWLSPEELQHMLKGSLQWSDVASHVNTSKTAIRKLSETHIKQPTPKQTTPKQSMSKQIAPIQIERSMKKEKHLNKLEGVPVIWLLGSVGLLTLSSWFYFVLSSK